MNVKRLPVILLIMSLVLGIMSLNGCKKDKKVEVTETTKKSVTTTLAPAKTTNRETTTVEPSTTTTTEVTTTTTTQPATTTTAPPSTTTTAPTTKTTAASTTKAPEKTTTKKSSGTYKDIESSMLKLVNKARKEAGKNSLQLSDSLVKCAKIRAKELVESYSHTRPDGSSCFTVFSENGVGYMSAGENIAWTSSESYGVSDVFQMWMDSPGHKANILSEQYDFNYFGCACYVGADGNQYWVQLFMYY